MPYATISSFVHQPGVKILPSGPGILRKHSDLVSSTQCILTQSWQSCPQTKVHQSVKTCRGGLYVFYQSLRLEETRFDCRFQSNTTFRLLNLQIFHALLRRGGGCLWLAKYGIGSQPCK